MKNHNVVSQTARNIPGFAGRRNPETPGNSDLPGPPECRNAGFIRFCRTNFPCFAGRIPIQSGNSPVLPVLPVRNSHPVEELVQLEVLGVLLTEK